jgi:hypothetical protein
MKCSQIFLVGVLCVSQIHSLPADDAIRFGQDVLPILSTNCFACHGPDESVRKGNLRLDLEQDAKAAHDSGVTIVPGSPDDSVLMQRILSTDADLIMPPPDSHNQLKPEQIATLKQWIKEGAVWGRHWSFEPIVRPEGSAVDSTGAIDEIVEKSLSKKQLSFSPEASPHQLIRRVALDLTGVPPTVEMADAFAANPTREAYEKLVDDLLLNPQFGEHWARVWMDLARYADTKGYEKDLGRTMWPYRDWLINSINADMPLDQMTVEQLAGDLIPNATTEQLIATAFHRNTMSNDEGGTDDEEFRTIAVKDRVDTTLQVWMGLTAGCAKCHTHKYDPISQHEYYGLYAIFNQTQDADRYDDGPTFEIPTPAIEEERGRINARITELKEKLATAEQASSKAEEAHWNFGPASEVISENKATLTVRDDNSIIATGTNPKEDVYTLLLPLKAGHHTVLRLEVLTEKFPDGQLGVGRNPRDPNFVLSELEVELVTGNDAKRLMLTNARADYSQEGWPVVNALDGDKTTGWAVSPRQRERHAALFTFAEPLQLDSDANLRITMRQHYGDSLVLRRFRLSTTGEDAAKIELPQPSADERRFIDELTAANKELAELNGRLPKIPVLRALEESKQRITKIHRRGNFLDQGDEVTASLPASFHKLDGAASVNRLELSQWLMSRENTLTARVWANRIWARLFGLGIVETEEDFGALGALPTHPELLDLIASEYRDNGWSLKKLLKTIVMSRTYRQSSEVTAKLREVDPRNQLLSRGPRFRLSAETVRDESLAAAGLLSKKMGGPPVMPPQPDGLWRSTYNGQKWVNAEGEDRFRRALYTYLKRTTPYPSMTTFDGGSGEVCQIRRIRTNTPLQALVTLNDPVYLEAAGALAATMAAVHGDPSVKASAGLRRALIRPLRDGEILPLIKLQQDAAQEYSALPEEAAALIKSAGTKAPDGLSDSDYAAWIVVANTILNLDEFLTKN